MKKPDDTPTWLTSLIEKLTSKGFVHTVNRPGVNDVVDHCFLGDIEVHAARDRSFWEVYVVYPALGKSGPAEFGSYAVSAYQFQRCLGGDSLPTAPDGPIVDAAYIGENIDKIIQHQDDWRFRLEVEQTRMLFSRIAERAETDVLRMDLTYQFSHALQERDNWTETHTSLLMNRLGEALGVASKRNGSWVTMGAVSAHVNAFMIFADFDAYVVVQTVLIESPAPAVFVPTHDSRQYVADADVLRQMFGPEIALSGDFGHPFSINDLRMTA